jgi:hypothetical protein
VRRLTVLCALAGLACGGGRPQTVSPQSINQTLDQFFAAVKANDLERMGALWGTERGPAIGWMKSEELRQRLTVIQRYLTHAGYRIVEGPLLLPGSGNERTFRIELQRQNGCNMVFPVNLVRAKSATWLVNDVHLDVVSNPAAACKPSSGTGP